MKLRCTRLDNNLLDIVTPGIRDLALGKSRMANDPFFSGLTAPDYESYSVFEEIFHPAIRELNNIQDDSDTPVQPASDFFGSENEEYFATMNIDPSGLILKRFTVEISRNLKVAALPKNLKLSELEKVEVALTAVLTVFYKKHKDSTFEDESGENHGSYYSLSEVLDNKEVFDDLKEEGLLADGIDDPVTDSWPYGRGVFVSPYGDVVAWINIRDHMKIFAVPPSAKSGAAGLAYKMAADVAQLLAERMEVKFDPKLGHLTSDPAMVGSGVRFKSMLNIPYLSKDRHALSELCKERGLHGGNNHKRSLPGSATRALTGKGRAQTENNVAPEEGDHVAERNDENAEPEGTSNREEMEERKDEDVDSQDDDNASISEDPADPPEPAFKPTNRDEHGQTILHFAAARSHGRNAIFQLLQEMDVNVGLRDGLYRTARDIAEQTDIRENVVGIDKFVVAIAARGENDKLTELLLEGYDHILDAEDGDNIIDVAKQRDNAQTAEFLGTITAFEIGYFLKNTIQKINLRFRRCSLHVAVLAQQENIVEYIASRYPTTLHIGDNNPRDGDLATVRIKAEKKLPVLPLGSSSDLRPGEWVVAMGSPLSLSNTVTAGVISTVQRKSAELKLFGKDIDYIQTDAAITFGNSGGPLVNLDGEVIGINAMKVAAGISFAIPIDYAKEFLRISAKRQSGGKVATAGNPKRYMGITMLSLTAQIIAEMRARNRPIPSNIDGGVLVWRVILGSPAHAAGLVPGDIVVELNGEKIQGASAVYKALETCNVLDLTVYRNGVYTTVKVVPEIIT
ncbi:unnamed protein product [Nesidiocoris tenuis]|uniref:Serine protease HTRA2, mitochondrial n=1 Tax=Nesidiocoris tenuis TaxID=355587 RepID=A0A6H5FSR0_9HEMI|nr:unnamed protein product [Nesidiocoris tenuis]